MRILIVDDNFDSCILYREMLAGIDADIAVCSSTEKPLHTLMQFLPDIVLLDLALPNACAKIVLGFIHTNPQLANTKTVLVSDDKQLLSYIAPQWFATTWLTKPILQNQLYATIGVAVR